MSLFENKDNVPDFDITEDDGLDLDKPKVQIIEDEEDTPESIQKKKKLFVMILSGILGVVLIGVLIFVLTLPKQAERVLPYDVANANGYSEYMDDVDLKEGEWSVVETTAEQAAILEGIVISPCNLLQKPSPYGNGILGLELNNTVNIIGEVIVDNEATGWLYVAKDDKKGYVHSEKIEINLEDTIDGYLTEEEEKYLNMSPEDLIKEFDATKKEELDERAKEIEEQAQLQQMQDAMIEDAERQEELQKQLEEQLILQEQGLEIKHPIQPLFHNQQTDKYFNADGLECDKNGNVIAPIE